MKLQKNGPWLEARITRGQASLTASDWLRQIGLPSAAVAALFVQNKVMLGKEPAAPDQKVRPGDRLRCLLFPEEPYGVDPEYIPLDPLYEDDHLIILNKPAGMKVHPNAPDERDTLMNALAFHYQMQGLTTRVRQLHRLDQDTSGAILFPKHAIAQHLLDAMLQARTLSREYWALVQGHMLQDHGVIDAPIGRDRYHATRRRVSQTGKSARTEYQVLARLHKATLVRAKLHTGRTHQIRVHFAHLGHPLIGDSLYGGPSCGLNRQALHARWLGFDHPLTGERIDIEAPLPQELIDLQAHFS
jgi:23S rRNA pseudouridine1911/1915/1917 synthase